MSFREADEFNAIHGNQFIADLMPKHPIYTAMLPETALAVIGVPHQSGRAAQRMLEKEGFAYENYVDIFDGGPTLTAATDSIATIRDARTDTVDAIGPVGGATSECLVAHGRLDSFRACLGRVSRTAGGVTLDADAAAALDASGGDSITWAPR
jgi:arginine N-succinyltransferase